jgi:hypothetical protein
MNIMSNVFYRVSWNKTGKYEYSTTTGITESPVVTKHTNLMYSFCTEFEYETYFTACCKTFYLRNG